MSKITKFVAALFSIWLALTIAVMLHEWTHGLLNWIFGFKSNPLDIYYGGFSLSNLLLYINIDDMTPYGTLSLMGHTYQAGIIAITPPIFINGLFTLLSGYWLSRNTKRSRHLNWWLFWFYLFNLQEFFSYTVQRCFSTHADTGLFLHFFHISPWWVFIPGLYLSLYGIKHAFDVHLPQIIKQYSIQPYWLRALLLFSTTATLLVLSSIRAITPNNTPSVQLLGYLTLLSIPICLIHYWPKIDTSC